MPQAKNEFGQLYDEGTKLKLWISMSDCARKIKLSRMSIRKYRQLDPDMLKTVREKNMFKRGMEALESYVKAKRGKAARCRTDQAEKPRKTIDNSAAESQTWQEKLCEGMVGLMREAVGPMQQPVPPPCDKLPDAAPAKVVQSTWVDDVIAGNRELKGDYPPNGIRFLLTAETFATLTSQFTSGEIKDTLAFVRTVLTPAVGEVRRRLVRSSELTNEKNRSEILKALGQELEELFLALEQAREVIPCKTFELYAERRGRLAAFHSTAK